VHKHYSENQAEHSLHCAVREGTASSIMVGAGESYLSAYALFLKATTSQIAFLAAVPALLGSFAQLIAAWIGHCTGRRKAIVLTGVIVQALMWLPMIWLPYFFPNHAVAILLASVVLYYMASNLASPVWNSLMGDLVPENGRGRYFARRSRLSSLANFIALAGAGFVLHFWEIQDKVQAGFLTVFSVAMVARLYSAYQISRMTEPVHIHLDTEARSLRGLLSGFKRSHFSRFSIFMALMNFSASIAGPFFAVYMLRDLGFSYLEFMASLATVVMMQFFSISIWGRISDAFGNRLILAVTGFIVPILPVLWLFSTNFWIILAIQLLGGLAWAGFNLSAGNFVYDSVPPSRRSVYGAIHNVVGAIAIFLGTALGGYLSTRLPAQAEIFGFHIEFASSLCWVFLISAVARLNTAISFIPLLKEARTVHRASFRMLINYIARAVVLPTFLSNLFARISRN
jgi:MFS family permease